MPMKAVQIAKSIQKCRLNGILRILPIAKYSLSHSEESVPVRHDETLKGGRITGSGGCQEGCLLPCDE